MFNELKDIYLNKYKILESLVFSSEIDPMFTNQKEELNFGENHYMKYFNLSDLKESINDISVEIIQILDTQEQVNYIERPQLLGGELL